MNKQEQKEHLISILKRNNMLGEMCEESMSSCDMCPLRYCSSFGCKKALKEYLQSMNEIDRLEFLIEVI